MYYCFLVFRRIHFPRSVLFSHPHQQLFTHSSNNEVPCLHRSDPVILQQLSLREKKNRAGLSEPSAFSVPIRRKTKTKNKKRCNHQGAVPAKQRRAGAQKSLEKVDVSVTALYSQLGEAFCVYLFSFLFFFFSPNLVLSFTLKHHTKKRRHTTQTSKTTKNIKNPDTL